MFTYLYSSHTDWKNLSCLKSHETERTRERPVSRLQTRTKLSSKASRNWRIQLRTLSISYHKPRSLYPDTYVMIRCTHNMVDILCIKSSILATQSVLNEKTEISPGGHYSYELHVYFIHNQSGHGPKAGFNDQNDNSIQCIDLLWIHTRWRHYNNQYPMTLLSSNQCLA